MSQWFGPAEWERAPAGPRRSGLSRARRDRLAEVLTSELLPRVIGARRPVAANLPVADPEALARALLAGVWRPRAAVAARLRAGATAPGVLLADLAGAARCLGRFWAEDFCDFVDVALATNALRALAREIVAEDFPSAVSAPAIVVTAAPGETHEFGADVAAAVFRAAGWRAARAGAGDIGETLAGERFDVAGFSLSCDRRLPGLAAAICDARARSLNPRLTVLVGGPAFAGRPDLAKNLGADVCATCVDMTADFPHGLLRALRL